MFFILLRDLIVWILGLLISDSKSFKFMGDPNYSVYGFRLEIALNPAIARLVFTANLMAPDIELLGY